LSSKTLGSYASKKSCECLYPYKAQSLYVSNAWVALGIGIHLCSTAEHTTREKINTFIIDKSYLNPIYCSEINERNTLMTDISKYRNVSLTHETYKILESLSKVILPDAKLSISKTIESIANEKARKLNGKVKKS
tara:strand:- start:119 stop:523 length:405 start_codon:yes stop_codon:yes gene_type:complete